MSFKIGQKIICINDNFNCLNRSEILPCKDNIYTIRSINMGIILVEIVNEHKQYREGIGELEFDPEAFRELNSETMRCMKSTDITVFLDMLNVQDIPLAGDIPE